MGKKCLVLVLDTPLLNKIIRRLVNTKTKIVNFSQGVKKLCLY